MRFYAVDQLGTKRRRTPEGYLLIEGVPIARIGTMLYGPGETPVPIGPDGYARIERNADEVFRPETIASMAGKPITNDHPPEDVSPSNWRQLSLGVAMNPRRGVGIEDDFTIADLLVQDAEAIRMIEEGKVELSCGYDANYDLLGPGLGRQRDIIYNHLALVDKGRCGPRCAIGDRQYEEITEMRTLDDATKVQTPWSKIRDKIAKAFDKKDEALLEEGIKDAEKCIEDAESGANHIEIHNHHPGAAGDKEREDEMNTEDKAPAWFRDSMKVVADRLDAMSEEMEEMKKGKAKDDEEEENEKKKKSEDNEKLEGNLEMEAPPGTGDKARKARDSAYLEDSFQDTIAMAEIIAPGIRVPTFDRAADPKKSFDTICSLRRTALDAADRDQATHLLLTEVLGGRTMDTKTMDCDAIRTTFKAIGALKRRANNEQSRVSDVIAGPGGGTGVRGKIKTIADLNAANAARYAKK